MSELLLAEFYKCGIVGLIVTTIILFVFLILCYCGTAYIIAGFLRPNRSIGYVLARWIKQNQYGLLSIASLFAGFAIWKWML
jgi:hypothetical protein